MIRVAMVAGLHNSSIKEKVLEKLQTAELTVAQIQEFVEQCEQTRQFVRQDETIDAATKSKSLDEINYNKSIRTIRENQISDCRYCGRSHAIRKCPAFGKQCTKCLYTAISPTFASLSLTEILQSAYTLQTIRAHPVKMIFFLWVPVAMLIMSMIPL